MTEASQPALGLPPDLVYALTAEPMRVVHPGPWVGHIPFAFWLVRSLRPATLVELGTHSGNSYFALCQAMAGLSVPGRAYAVDTWKGDEHAGLYGEDVFAGVHGFNTEHFSTFSTLLRTTFDDARSYFPDADTEGRSDEGIDLLHIDGLHTYEAVRHDFETWRPALSSRAIVLFHDINVREREFGVWRFWEDIRREYPSFAFHHSHGLGVLGVGTALPGAVRAMFDANAAEAGTLRACLAARGEAFQRQVELSHLREQVLRQTAALEAAAHDGAMAREALTRKDADFQDAVAWRDTLLQSERELIASKDVMLARLENIADARAHALDVRDELINARDVLASQLLQDVRHQEFLVREERRVRDEMQHGYEDAIAKITRHTEHLDAQIQRAAQEVQRATQEVQNALAAGEALARQAWTDAETTVTRRFITSTSWKLTRPLRVATRLVRGGGLYPAGVIAGEMPHPVRLPAPISAPAPQAILSQDDQPAEIERDTHDVSAPTALKQAFRKLLSVRLDSFLAGTDRLRLPRAEQPDVSILLVLFNQAELTFACLSSIIETLSGASFGVEVVIADNGSSDATAALLNRTDGATILRNDANLHFLKAVNLAARDATGRTLLLLNNDAQLLPGSLEAALRTLASDADIGAVGGRIILPDGTLQEAGSIIWQDGACSGYARGRSPTDSDVMFQRDVDYCSGAFLLTPADTWRELGGFDERFAPAYYEETDYCVRLWRSGRRVVFDPDVAIVHFEFGSAKASDEALKQQAANHGIFVSRHQDWLKGQFPASPRNALLASRAHSDAPNILVLEDRVPRVELGSGYPRANRLIHELAKAGANVTLFPMVRFRQDWHDVRAALDKTIEVQIHAEAAELRDFLLARPNQFDVILVCRPHNMRSFLAAIGPERAMLGGASVLYDAEALFVTRDIQRLEAEGRPATADEQHRMVAQEVALTRLSDAVLSVSEAERDTLQQYGAREVHLLGHALEDAPLPTGFADRDQIVFLGTIGADDLPNADAVRWFASAILPPLREELGQDEFRLTVIGLNKAPTVSALDGISIDLVGMVDELPPALSRARVMVVPSRFGAGIPMKAHQTAMMGIPLVTTTLIARQLGWQDGEDLLVADDPREFAAACARLYQDQDLWERVRVNALARAQQDCAPAVFVRRIKEIVDGARIVRRQPDGRPSAPITQVRSIANKEEPNTSRPAEQDWCVAVPFDYAPSLPTNKADPRLGVFCHFFHTFVAAEALHYLRQLPLAADLLITTDTAEKEAELRAAFEGWEKGRVELRVTPNRGRDIAPKLIGFADMYDRYDLVLHIHSKMSTHAAFLGPWRSYLFETLMGSPEVVRSILSAFDYLPDLGMVAPQHFEAIRRWLGWNGNYEVASTLAKRMGIGLSPTKALDFPSGSMFWARPSALRPLLDLSLGFEEFPDENAQVDHTPAHAIERMFFHACERSGHTWLKVAQPALMHDTSHIATIADSAMLSRFMVEHGVMLTGPALLGTADSPAPMLTRVAPGLARRLAGRPPFAEA